jgi:hypothetical protein
MSKRDELLGSIASTIRDYRKGEIALPDADHVDQWVRQFDAAVQVQILAELSHVLEHTYLDQENVTTFLRGLITNEKLTGKEPCAFWRTVSFLDIQAGGHSQQEMLQVFDAFLKSHCGFGIAECGKGATTYVYIDDAIFTGNRVLKDLTNWIQREAPSQATIHIITMAYHRGGQYYAEQMIAEALKAAGKKISLTWWRCIELEDRKWGIDNSDVLRPRGLGTDPLVAAYAASLKYSPAFRSKDSVGEHGFFSSEAGRNLLEQEMLKAGARIRNMCPHLGKYQRPLGNMVLETLGFGSTLVTFRNCPNNAPLAFWAGDPWYPLFPRKTNSYIDLSAFQIEL